MIAFARLVVLPPRLALIRWLRVLAFGWCFWPLCVAGGADQDLRIRVLVDDKAVSLPRSGNLLLNAVPHKVTFAFGAPGGPLAPIRLRYKLEGIDNDWHEGRAFMFLAVRFFNEAGEPILEKRFPASDESSGWKGSFENSPLTHRREVLLVPSKASSAWIIISSAGPPATVGVYVVANLTVTGSRANALSAGLIPSPFEHLSPGNSNGAPAGWARDGTHPDMAKIIQIGEAPPVNAFAIEDDDTIGHAEWHTVREIAPAVRPGENLVVEWNEMFSIGLGDMDHVNYADLPPGSYRFRVASVDIMGRSDGPAAEFALSVPPPVWKRPWFWTASTVIAAIMIAGVARFLVWQKIRREMLRLKSQQALERERLRIARDIHDDLGARVTQISLVSAMFQDDSALPEKARAGFEEIKQLSQNLVSVLYETVWAVNPDYDNLSALGDYLCQMANGLCKQTPIHCRLQVEDLPSEIQISSYVRHNLVMMVKEAIHNVIKHAQASELLLRISFSNDLLNIVIQDNGMGLPVANGRRGHGLTNIRERISNIGGRFSLDSQPGQGSAVHLWLGLACFDFCKDHER